jgi:hypothetical protein
LAFEAVKGVLGVLDIIWAEGVEGSESSSRSANASIFAVMGVPRGSRFRGGSFRFFLPKAAFDWGLASGVFIERSSK